jgi:hypothetical protein
MKDVCGGSLSVCGRVAADKNPGRLLAVPSNGGFGKRNRLDPWRLVRVKADICQSTPHTFGAAKF